MPLICAFTPICEDDAHWIPQYLSEAERLQLPFVVHFDRCSSATKLKMLSSQLCVDHTSQDDPDREYDEKAKQGAMDAALRRSEWALQWDVDETWNAMPTEFPNVACIDVRWLNLWEDDAHIRVDGIFGEGSRTRTKLYRRPKRDHLRWTFCSSVVYGPTLVHVRGSFGAVHVASAYMDGVHCLHHGYKTVELRRQHKERWDRVYGSHNDGRNPYGTWDFICDESIVPVVEEYKW